MVLRRISKGVLRHGYGELQISLGKLANANVSVGKWRMTNMEVILGISCIPA
jgi:hypothetical protein